MKVICILPDNALPESVDRRSREIRETINDSYPSAEVEVRVKANMAGCPSVFLVLDYPHYQFGQMADMSKTIEGIR